MKEHVDRDHKAAKLSLSNLENNWAEQVFQGSFTARQALSRSASEFENILTLETLEAHMAAVRVVAKNVLSHCTVTF